MDQATFVSESLASIGSDDAIIAANPSGQSHPSSPIPFRFRVSKPTQFFVGRQPELDQLYEFYRTRSNFLIVISGMGGQGKTQLCLQFLNTLTHQPSLIWLNGDGPTNLTLSLARVAECLQIPHGNSVVLDEILAQVSSKMSTNSPTGWVVVIDNVDEMYVEFTLTIPILLGHGAFVLVTTRRMDILSGEAEHLKLDVLNQIDAQHLIQKQLGPQSEEDLKNLCHEMGNHALALRQSVSYIRSQQIENRSTYSIPDYLSDLAKDKTLLANRHFC